MKRVDVDVEASIATVQGGATAVDVISAAAPHGLVAATRVPLAATAFGLREEHFMVEIVATREPSAGDDGHTHRQWARTLSQNLAPHALPGGYPNMLGPEEHEQTAQAFGSNLGKLQRVNHLLFILILNGGREKHVLPGLGIGRKL